MTGRRVTMKDVAQRAGVSTAAVSFAYTQPDRLTKETLQRIQDSARDLGYVRDWSARALRRGRTDTIGIVLPQSVDDAFMNAYYPQFVQGVGRVCKEHGLMLLLVPPAEGLSGGFAEAAADGFIVVGLVAERTEVASIRASHVPLVLVDSDPVPGVPLVTVDEQAAMRDLVSRLIALGHRHFGVAAIETGESGGPLTWSGAMRHRMEGVWEALADAGIPADAGHLTVTEVPSSGDGGALAFAQLKGAKAGPTAMVAFSDEIALGIVRAARQHGVEIPRDLSVTGFDDVEAARLAQPPLTTISQPIVDKGERAARALLAQMRRRGGDDVTVLPARVIERASTGRAARS